MAEISNVSAGNIIASVWGNLIRDRTVQRYASATARNTAHPSPAAGDLSFLQDTGALYIYFSGAWQLVPSGTFEIDGHVEAAGPIAQTGTSTARATISLAIPSNWGSWKCFAEASWMATGDVLGIGEAFLRIDGTNSQRRRWQIPSGQPGSPSVSANSSINARRTGMTTTGSRSIQLMMAEISGDHSVWDIAMYARAVRTS